MVMILPSLVLPHPVATILNPSRSASSSPNSGRHIGRIVSDFKKLRKLRRSMLIYHEI